MSSFKVLDGAMGTELIKRGITLPKHIWSADANINHPELVQKIHKEYVDAGANYITTNTFRTTPRSYAKINTKVNVQDANTSLLRAVELAKCSVGSSTKILGSIAPLEDCYRPNLFPGKDIAISEFYELGEWLTGAGVHVLLLETMNSIVETKAALEAIRGFVLPIWVSFVLKNNDCLLSGEPLISALNILKNHGVDMILLNCNPLNRTMGAVDNIVNNWRGDWGIYPNLGRGEPSPYGNIVKYEPINQFISVIEYAVGLGASVVGGCCGTSPEHISKIKYLKDNIA